MATNQLPQTAIQLPAAIHHAMIAHARRELPNECCGLLAGTDRTVRSIYPLKNEAEQPQTEFFAGVGLFQPFKEMRRNDQTLIAIYHSHPKNPAVPSQKDIERNEYPGVIHFIVSLLSDPPQIAAFHLTRSGYETADWTLVPADSE